MRIEATCGCGAKVQIDPAGSHYNDYNSTATITAERDAVKAAFERWVQAHQTCGKRPEIRYPAYLNNDPPPLSPQSPE